MKKRTILTLAALVLLLTVLAAVAQAASADPTIKPDFVLESDLTVQVEYVNTMPYVLGPGIIPGTMAQNLNSPVSFKKKLYLIDQNDAIYRLNGKSFQKIFSCERSA